MSILTLPTIETLEAACADFSGWSRDGLVKAFLDNDACAFHAESDGDDDLLDRHHEIDWAIRKHYAESYGGAALFEDVMKA